MMGAGFKRAVHGAASCAIPRLVQGMGLGVWSTHVAVISFANDLTRWIHDNGADDGVGTHAPSGAGSQLQGSPHETGVAGATVTGTIAVGRSAHGISTRIWPTPTFSSSSHACTETTCAPGGSGGDVKRSCSCGVSNSPSAAASRVVSSS